jgi:hypothetical protein
VARGGDRSEHKRGGCGGGTPAGIRVSRWRWSIVYRVGVGAASSDARPRPNPLSKPSGASLRFSAPTARTTRPAQSSRACKRMRMDMRAQGKVHVDEVETGPSSPVVAVPRPDGVAQSHKSLLPPPTSSSLIPSGKWGIGPAAFQTHPRGTSVAAVFLGDPRGGVAFLTRWSSPHRRPLRSSSQRPRILALSIAHVHGCSTFPWDCSVQLQRSGPLIHPAASFAQVPSCPLRFPSDHLSAGRFSVLLPDWHCPRNVRPSYAFSRLALVLTVRQHRTSPSFPRAAAAPVPSRPEPSRCRAIACRSKHIFTRVTPIPRRHLHLARPRAPSPFFLVRRGLDVRMRSLSLHSSLLPRYLLPKPRNARAPSRCRT